jgi:hypothetical protein
MNKFFVTLKVDQSSYGPIQLNPSLDNPTNVSTMFGIVGIQSTIQMAATGAHRITLVNTQKDNTRYPTVTLTFINTEDPSKNWTQELKVVLLPGRKVTFRSS